MVMWWSCDGHVMVMRWSWDGHVIVMWLSCDCHVTEGVPLLPGLSLGQLQMTQHRRADDTVESLRYCEKKKVHHKSLTWLLFTALNILSGIQWFILRHIQWYTEIYWTKVCWNVPLTWVPQYSHTSQRWWGPGSRGVPGMSHSWWMLDHIQTMQPASISDHQSGANKLGTQRS